MEKSMIPVIEGGWVQFFNIDNAENNSRTSGLQITLLFDSQNCKTTEKPQLLFSLNDFIESFRK